MRAAVVSALLVSGMTGLFVACVGDDPATAVPRVSPDGSTNASGGASSSGQASSSGGSSGEGPSDGSTDAATLACGYPGEPCCVAPTRLCRAGTVCSTSSTTCVVSDMVAVGRFGLLGKRPISSRWDGSTWTKPVVVDNEDFVPTDLWVEEDAVRLVATGPESRGRMYSLAGTADSPSWALCRVGHSCAAPSTLFPRLSSVVHVAGDWWIAGSSSFYRCTGAMCPKQETGLEGQTWGDGTLVGSSPQDLWFGSYNQLFQFDGTAWKIHGGVKARALHQVRKDDIWAADERFQHWNGTAWSDETSLSNGEGVPGSVTSMSGSAADDIWAVGNNNGNDAPFAAHWNGLAWSLVPFPASALRVDRVWAPSRAEAYVTSWGGIWRWTGSEWVAMPLPPRSQEVDDAGTSFDSWQLLGGSARPRP